MKKKAFTQALNDGFHFEAASEETVLSSIQNTTFGKYILHRNRMKNGTKITPTALYIYNIIM